MSDGPWDGSDLAPRHILPSAGGEAVVAEEGEGQPPAGGGGGGGGEEHPLDPRSPTAQPPSDLQVDEWPDYGVKPALGGLTI